jgi:hypothetical protein
VFDYHSSDHSICVYEVLIYICFCFIFQYAKALERKSASHHSRVEERTAKVNSVAFTYFFHLVF